MSSRQPISTWTGLAFPLAALAVLEREATFEAGVLAFFLVCLGIATWAFHWRWTPAHADLDHAGMNAVLAALATLCVGGGGWAMLVAGLGFGAAEYALDPPNRPMIAAFAWSALVATGASVGWAAAALAAGLMGTGYAVWHLEGDLAHGLWHTLEAAGMAVLAVSALI